MNAAARLGAARGVVGSGGANDGRLQAAAPRVCRVPDAASELGLQVPSGSVEGRDWQRRIELERRELCIGGRSFGWRSHEAPAPRQDLAIELGLEWRQSRGRRSQQATATTSEQSAGCLLDESSKTATKTPPLDSHPEARASLAQPHARPFWPHPPAGGGAEAVAYQQAAQLGLCRPRAAPPTMMASAGSALSPAADFLDAPSYQRAYLAAHRLGGDLGGLCLPARYDWAGGASTSSVQAPLVQQQQQQQPPIEDAFGELLLEPPQPRQEDEENTRQRHSCDLDFSRQHQRPSGYSIDSGSVFSNGAQAGGPLHHYQDCACLECSERLLRQLESHTPPLQLQAGTSFESYRRRQQQPDISSNNHEDDANHTSNSIISQRCCSSVSMPVGAGAANGYYQIGDPPPPPTSSRVLSQHSQQTPNLMISHRLHRQQQQSMPRVGPLPVHALQFQHQALSAHPNHSHLTPNHNLEPLHLQVIPNRPFQQRNWQDHNLAGAAQVAWSLPSSPVSVRESRQHERHRMAPAATHHQSSSISAERQLQPQSRPHSWLKSHVQNYNIQLVDFGGNSCASMGEVAGGRPAARGSRPAGANQANLFQNSTQFYWDCAAENGQSSQEAGAYENDYEGEGEVEEDEEEEEEEEEGEEDEGVERQALALVPKQAKGRLPLSIAEQMSEQATEFVQRHGSAADLARAHSTVSDHHQHHSRPTSTARGQHSHQQSQRSREQANSSESSSSLGKMSSQCQHQYATGVTSRPTSSSGRVNNFKRDRSNNNLQVRRTLRVKIRKSKPILGIAIEGGFNVSGQLIPRIVCVHEEGAAYQCGKLRASDLILEVNGISTVNMTHNEIAETIANAYYQDESPYIEFLIGESVHV